MEMCLKITAACLLASGVSASEARSTAALATPKSRVVDCPRLWAPGVSTSALERAAESGDTSSALCLAKHLHLKHLDGGELEDALVALGSYGDHHPRELLLMTKHGQLTDINLADAVRMLSDNFVDQFKAQARAMRARRERFRSVTDPLLASQRGVALRSIELAIREVSQHLD